VVVQDVMLQEGEVVNTLRVVNVAFAAAAVNMALALPQELKPQPLQPPHNKLVQCRCLHGCPHLSSSKVRREK
jgi:hypothetical protein